MEATAEAEARVREHGGELAALDALAQHSNWSNAPAADLNGDDRKTHV